MSGPDDRLLPLSARKSGLILPADRSWRRSRARNNREYSVLRQVIGVHSNIEVVLLQIGSIRRMTFCTRSQVFHNLCYDKILDCI